MLTGFVRTLPATVTVKQGGRIPPAPHLRAALVEKTQGWYTGQIKRQESLNRNR